jgi:hypothetical protein
MSRSIPKYNFRPALSRMIRENPWIVYIAVQILRICPPVLGFVRRTLFYSDKEASFPFSILPTFQVGVKLPGDHSRRTIFVDVSATTRHDQKTGMHRVTRELLRHWFHNPPAGWRISPVYTDGVKFYNFLQLNNVRPDGSVVIATKRHEEIAPGPSDIMVLLDLDVYLIREMERPLEEIRNRGTIVYALVHDLIPIFYPDFAPDLFSRNFKLWFDVILRQADGIITGARTITEEIRHWADTHPPHRVRPLRMGFSHHGADIKVAVEESNLDDTVKVAEILGGRPSVLMVSTLEPRKGYAQAVLAFEALWALGVDVNLVIVGKTGWKVEALIDRLTSHPENGRRLFWFQYANDSFLSALYCACSVLLSASESEGFGLPLVEAAQRGLPIIARDIPVFREVAGNHAYYFSGLTGEALAGALQEWLSLWKRNLAPRSDGLNWITWEQSAANFMRLILDKNASGWLPDWAPPAGISSSYIEGS